MPSTAAGYVPWFRRPVLWVFIGAILLRLVVLSRLAETPYFLLQMGDMRFYHQWALRILGGQWTDHHAFYGLPGYAFALAGIYKLSGTTDFQIHCWLVGILQILFEAVTASIIFKIASSICESERIQRSNAGRSKVNARLPTAAGVLAALLWVTCIPAQTFSAILMPTSWVLCAFWAGVHLLSRPLRGSIWWPWLPLGGGIGVFSMLVAMITSLVPLALVRIGLSVGSNEASARRAGKALAAALLLVGGIFAGASPAWIHNYFIAHDPVLLSAHSGINMWMGNNPGSNGYPQVPSGLRMTQDGLLRDSITRAEEAVGRPLLRSEVSRYWSDQANAYIRTHRPAWLRLLGVKFRNFWNRFQYDDLSVVTLLKQRGVLWPGPIWGDLAVIGLAGLPFALRFSPRGRWVAAAVILHMLAVMPVFVTERYRLCAAPGLIIVGVYGFYRFYENTRAARYGESTAYLGLLAAAGVFTSLPVADPALRSLDPFNVGVKELEVATLLRGMQGTPAERAQYQAEAREELRRADGHLHQAYALVQRDPGITFALGNLAYDRGDLAGAREFYHRTLALNPRFSGALNNLGFLALEERRWEEAQYYLESATRAEPENAKSFYLLAQAWEGLGNFPAAQAAIKEALRLSPQQPEFRRLADHLAGRLVP